MTARFPCPLNFRGDGGLRPLRPSEFEPQRALELAGCQGVLQADQAERGETVELKVRAPVGLWENHVAESRRTRCGVVEDVRGVEPNLESLGFVEPESLTQRSVEGPPPRPFHRVRPKISPGSGLHILEDYSLSSVGVNDG